MKERVMRAGPKGGADHGHGRRRGEIVGTQEGTEDPGLETEGGENLDQERGKGGPNQEIEADDQGPGINLVNTRNIKGSLEADHDQNSALCCP
jgi:hypothetical protein